MKRFTVCIGLILLILAASGAMAGKAEEPDQARVNTISKELMRQCAIPGLAVAVIAQDQTHTYLFGQADPTNGKRVTENTIFEVGSLTKLFTALLCAEAAEDGRLDLDKPIPQYCPPLAENPNFAQMTLAHMAGFPLNLEEAMKNDHPFEYYLTAWQPEQPVGSQWQYSNVGCGLAALVLEKQDHQSINTLIKTNILAPLKMSPLGLEVSDEYLNDYAQGCTSDGKVSIRMPWASGLYPGAWGLKATIRDMAKFLAVAVGLPQAPPNLVKAMHNTQTPRVRVDNMQQALVWQVHSLQDESLKHEPQNMNIGPLPAKWLPKDQQIYKDDVLLDKTGSMPGFRSYMAVIPSRRVGVVILANKNIPNGAIVTAGRAMIGIE